jgi:hypothetical protein
MQVDTARSRRIAEQLATEFRDCHQNAYWAINQIPELADALYVEGYAVSDGPSPPREHEWIELNGTILDPTLALFDAEHVQYFPGPRFTRQEVCERVCEIGALPPLHEYGCGGYDSPEMMRAGALASEAVDWKDMAERYWLHYERAKALSDRASH